MSLRPSAARWFELLTTREDAAQALELLARTGAIELETRREDSRLLSLRGMRALAAGYQTLYRRFHAYWPQPDRSRATGRGARPYRTLKHALAVLQRWEEEAVPLVGRLESLTARQNDLQLFENLLRSAADDGMDCTCLSMASTVVQARLFVLPPDSRFAEFPERLLIKRYVTPQRIFLMAVGQPADIEQFTQVLSVFKGRILPIPDFLSGDAHLALQQVETRSAELDIELATTRKQIDALNTHLGLGATLADMQRLDWFLRQVDSLPVSENFAWITGWTNDLDGRRLEAALAGSGVHALIHFPPPPADAQPPMLLRNSRWGRPFETFVSMLGTPAAGDVDPSSLLMLMVPLLFGYMFGDVGQGLVLVLAGLLLRRRWPVLDVLVLNGLSAVAFGFAFGSVFGREDLIAPLWLHPLEQPLLVLQVPLVGGVLILLLGLLLRALQYYWRNAAAEWWRLEAPQLLLYIGVLTLLFSARAWWLVAAALAWYLAGCRRQQRSAAGFSLAAAVGTMLENLVQLLINTLSFVRVGAFALAHAGLSLAFVTLAGMPDSVWLAAVILLTGNLVIMALEGLVVTIQTTRLVLFEFFIRFMRAEGRVFRPLAAPVARVGLESQS